MSDTDTASERSAHSVQEVDLHDEALARHETGTVEYFVRGPVDGGRSDQFLTGLDLEFVSRTDNRVVYLRAVLEGIRDGRKTTAPARKQTTAPARKRAIEALAGMAAAERLVILSGFCQNDKGETDSRCRRCVERGLPCVAPGFEDDKAKPQLRGACVGCHIPGGGKCGLRVHGPDRRSKMFGNKLEKKRAADRALNTVQNFHTLSKAKPNESVVYAQAAEAAALDYTDVLSTPTKKGGKVRAAMKRKVEHMEEVLGRAIKGGRKSISHDRLPPTMPKNLRRPSDKPIEAWYPFRAEAWARVNVLDFATSLALSNAVGNKPAVDVEPVRRTRHASHALVEKYGDKARCRSVFVETAVNPAHEGYRGNAPTIPEPHPEGIARMLKDHGNLTRANLTLFGIPEAQIDALLAKFDIVE